MITPEKVGLLPARPVAVISQNGTSGEFHGAGIILVSSILGVQAQRTPLCTSGA